MSEQLTLFNGKSFNPIARVKEAMRRAIKQSELSREEVVFRMNELARVDGITTGGKAKKISTELLDKWLSHSVEHLIPWKLLPIFCHVVNSIDPIRPLLALLDAHVVSKDDWVMLEWARAERERRRIMKKQRLLEGKMNL